MRVARKPVVIVRKRSVGCGSESELVDLSRYFPIVKLRGGGENARAAGLSPLPSRPWHSAQFFSKSFAPSARVASVDGGRVGTSTARHEGLRPGTPRGAAGGGIPGSSASSKRAFTWTIHQPSPTAAIASAAGTLSGKAKWVFLPSRGL